MTPAKKRPAAKAKAAPPGERAAGNAAARRNSAAQAQRETRLRESVASERRKVRSGKSNLRADSGNVTRGTRVLPGERERADRAAAEEASAVLAGLVGARNSIVSRRSQVGTKREVKRRNDEFDVSAALGGAASARALDTALAGGLRELVDRELSGRGKLAELSGKGAEWADRKNVRIALPGAREASLLIPGLDGLLERGTKDLINLPAQLPASVYVPLAGLAEYARGDDKRLRQLGTDIKETDPLYALLTGRPREAAKRASEHPGFTAVEAAGIRGVGGRTAGKAVRGTARVTGSKRLRDIGSVTNRPDAVVPGTALREVREYSPDLARKGAQVLRDKDRSRRAQRLRAEARKVQDSDSERATALRKKANQVDPRIASDYAVKARINLLEARGENLRRRAAGDVDKRVQSILKDAGDEGAAPVLVASGVTRASVADLRAYRKELDGVHATLTDPGKRAANVALRKAIDVSLVTAKRGGDPQLRQVLAAAKRYSREIDQPLDRTLADMGLLNRERGERAKLIPLAARELGATVDDGVGLNVGGRTLSPDELRTLARAEREVDPSYVSQAPGARGPGAYYRASASEPVIGSRARTERPTREGTFDAAPEMLRARAINATGIVQAAKNFRAVLAETGLRGRDGKVVRVTRERGELLKRALEADRGLEFALVAEKPWAARGEQVRQLQDAIDSGADLDPRAFEAFRDGLVEAFKGKGDGMFVLVPRAAARQQVQHLRVLNPTDFGKVARGVRSSFTRTVLTTSPGPTFGNLVEPGVRAAISRAGPLSYYRARGVLRELKQIDPEAAAKLDASIGQGKVTLASRRRYVDPMQFDQGMLRRSVAGWQAVKRARGANRLVEAWNMWTYFVFETVNGRAEGFYREGPMLGKALRDSGLMDDTVLAVSRHAMREAAKGLTDTPTQALLAKKLNDMYGKYQGFGPSGRKIIAEYTPFAAWFLSAWTFIAKVLPRDHPGVLLSAAVLANASEDWRMAQGLDLFAGKGKLPGWLQGTVPVSAGRLKLAYNTPFGVATDPLKATSSLVFPQGDNLLKAFQGLDWKNKKLRNDDGSEYDTIQQALYAMGEVAKSTVPAVAVPLKTKRYVEKPGTLLNPVLIPPRKGTQGVDASPAEEKALQREEKALRAAGRAEEEALKREERAILRERKRLEP